MQRGSPAYMLLMQHSCAGDAGQQYELRLIVLSDGSGSFAIKVNVPPKSSEVVARHFTGMMQLVESDVRQLLAS